MCPSHTPLLDPGIAEAVRLTRAGRLQEATTLLQFLAGGGALLASTARAGSAPGAVLTLDGVAEPADAGASGGGRPAARPEAARAGSMRPATAFARAPARAPAFPAGPDAPVAGRLAATLGSTLAGLAHRSGPDTRPYRLHVPAGLRPGAPLVVMLHGCTQTALDFSLGTRMNEAAERHGCLVLWPEQVTAANASRCWRWFEPGDQRRDQGEPALIAALTRRVIAEQGADPARVYVAGLSAGGAAAAVLGQVYPDLYAAIGVHSGLRCGAAHDTASAMVAMKSDPALRRARPDTGVAGSGLRAIVFHGDADRVVHPGHAEAVLAQISADPSWIRRSERGQVEGGRAYERIWHVAADGTTMLEQWRVQGAGHAWSGGNAAGSYTDPRGPDATEEMLRFFLQHPRIIV